MVAICTNLRGTVGQIAVERLWRVDVVSLCKSEVNKNRHVLVREEDIRRSSCISIAYCSAISSNRDLLDVVVYDAPLVQELDPRQKGAEPFLRVRLGDLDGDEAGVEGPGRREARSDTHSGAGMNKATAEEGLHGDKGIRGRDDERVEGDDGRVGFVFQ